MTDPKNIPHLVKLLDDDSLDIQRNVLKELAAFGPILRKEIGNLSFELNTIQKEYLDIIFEGQKRVQVKQNWSKWFKYKDDYKKLESSISTLSHYVNNSINEREVSDLLDELAKEYREKFAQCDERLLAQFLFKDKGLVGDELDYYNPENNNLIHVIKNKKGIPISLACIYMLVGHRLGLRIEGCQFPGHFLARIYLNGKRAFVDCFSGGHIIEEDDIMKVREDILDSIQSILREKTDVEMIIRRYLANLVRAYQMREDNDNSELMIDLFKEIDEVYKNQSFQDVMPNDIISDKRNLYKVGQVIRHKRYGYRGIIVDIDDVCEATDSWYYSNQTQPNRDQPWIHVLVDGSDQVTYVASSNLSEDFSDEKIEHPLISYFFSKEEDGSYIRNENLWPGTEF